MRLGTTSLQLTSALAKGLHRPKLRTDLTISKQTVQGENSYVIKIQEAGTYARYSALEYDLMSLCDGMRTPAEIAEALTEMYPGTQISEQEVLDYLDASNPDLWERSLGQKNLAVLGRIRQERKSRAQQSSLLYIVLTAWASDRFLTRAHPYLRWLYTPEFVGFSLLLFATVGAIVAGDYTRIRQDTLEFYNFRHKSLYDLWIFWVLLFIVSGIHEFGHGLTCKHFGGEVPKMGLMLVYFTPAFYTDCTEMCMFDRTSKRQWTIIGGIWAELVLCGIATLIWYLSPPGSFVADLSYKTLLLTGVSGVFINLNPLMKFDGYYLLSQFLEMDDLREDSFDYLKLWLRRYLLRQDVQLPPVTKRKRRIYLAFAPAAFFYGLTVLILVAGLLKNIFVNRFGDFWGYLFTAGVLYLILRKRLQKWLPGWIGGLRNAKEKFMAWKLTRAQQMGGLALILLLVAVPTATKINTNFILEPVARAEVRAPAAGVVIQVPVREGQQVGAGTVLAVLSNPELEAHAAVVARELDQAEHALLAARADNNMEEIGRQSQQVQRLETDLTESRRKVDGLVLRSPIDGVVTTPQVDQKVGSYLTEGDGFAIVADRSSMKARVLVRDTDLEDIRLGAKVKLKVLAEPMATYSGYVQQIMPAAAVDQPIAEPPKLVRYGQELTNYFAVVLQIPNSSAGLQEGMTGTAKIYGRRYPAAWRAGRRVWRWLRFLVW
jgi:putative peptide zinc metalloprotease protein